MIVEIFPDNIDTKKLSRWQDLLKKMRAEGFAIGEG